MNKQRLLLSVSLAAALGAGAAHAQAPVAPGSGSTTDQPRSANQVEEVIVTATRRETNLQSTPVSVTAITASQIAQTSPTNIGDLSVFVPNFSASKVTGFNAASFAIRGTSQTSILVYNEPPVAVLVDDFVIPHVSSQLLDTFDLEDVQVLRGPQGTLFGKNTTGGAIILRTKRPNLTEAGMEAQGEIGSFGTTNLKAAVDVPIINDKLALRLVGTYDKDHGFMKNGECWGPLTPVGTTLYAGDTGCGDGRSVGGANVFYGRAKLLFQPTDNFTALLQYEIQRDHSGVPGQVNVTPIGDMTFLTNRLGFYQNPGDPIDNAGQSGRDDALQDQSGGQRVDIDGGYLNLDYRTPIGNFTSVTGYRLEHESLPQSAIPIPGPQSLFDYNRSNDRRTFQEEVRFASTFNGPFNFVAGAFYAHDSVNYCVAQVLGYNDLLGKVTPYGSYNDNPEIQCSAQRSSSEAAYAEGNYKITDKLTLTVGGRITREHKLWMGRPEIFIQNLKGTPDPTFTWQQLGDILNGADFKTYPFEVVSNSHTWTAPTWKANLSYQFTDDIFGYLTYSRGFKSGSYGDSAGGAGLPLTQAEIAPTNPEYANSYEAGLKLQGWDRRARLNLSAFHVDYIDAQRQVVVPIIRADGTPFQNTQFFNAAHAVVNGVEAEGTLVPVDNLTLRAVVGYQHGFYDSFVSPFPTGRDLAQSPLARTPPWQVTLNANYVVPLGTYGDLAFDVTYAHQDRNLFTLDIRSAANDTYMDAQNLLHASVTWNDPDHRYYVKVLGRNLTDERYIQAAQTVGGLFSYALYGEPRYVGVQVGVKWGGA